MVGSIRNKFTISKMIHADTIFSPYWYSMVILFRDA